MVVSTNETFWKSSVSMKNLMRSPQRSFPFYFRTMFASESQNPQIRNLEKEFVSLHMNAI